MPFRAKQTAAIKKYLETVKIALLNWVGSTELIGLKDRPSDKDLLSELKPPFFALKTVL